MSLKTQIAATAGALQTLREQTAVLLKHLDKAVGAHEHTNVIIDAMIDDINDAYSDFATAMGTISYPTVVPQESDYTYDIMFSEINRNGDIITAEDVADDDVLAQELLDEGSKMLRIHAPTADFTKAIASPYDHQAEHFTDTSSNAPTSWLWDFGDETTSTLQNPVKTWLVAGTYTVSLTATNEGGSNTHSVSVVVQVD